MPGVISATFSSPDTHAGSALITVDGNGVANVYKLSPDSTVKVTPLPTGSLPITTYNGTSAADAVSSITTDIELWMSS